MPVTDPEVTPAVPPVPLATRVRNVMPLQARLRSVPLAVKLVAAVLALVFAALVLISVASTFALRYYLVGRIDDQLHDYIAAVADPSELPGFDQRSIPVPPTDYFISVTSMDGVGKAIYDDRKVTEADLPPLVKGVDAVQDRANKPFTVRSAKGHVDWRMLVTTQEGSGSVLHVAINMSGVESAVGRLIWIDLMVGGAVLIALASVGAAIVRQSLIPLGQIERTAAAIAAGDLSRRVPDPEPYYGEPRTELGRLSRALNAMLTQIETAFTARAMSETAARSAELAARDAAEAALQSESRAVRSEEKMRQFVADASHELRTPLTTIRGFAELYRQGAVTPADTGKLVRRIEDEAARMGLLVEDLLLLARLDRERPLTLAPVELPVLAVDAVQAAQATAPDRTIELEIRDTPAKLIAYGDDARLRQVIGNLMTNALTHTPPDASVALRLYAEPGNVAVVEIADTGPGLSPEQQEHVFERFYRADEARTRRTDRAATGTGLGLAIVAAIVRVHHGSVEVLSAPGKGATFRVRLPLAPAE